MRAYAVFCSVLSPVLTPVCATSTLLVVSAFLSFGAQTAQAGQWGLSIAYNNPAGADIGGNFTYFGSQFAFEIGVGSVGASGNESTKSAGLAGDIDVKMMFSSKWRPYIEAGLGMGLGGAVGKGGGFRIGAGSPFVGVGLLYDGSPMFCYLAADYKFSPQKFYPVVGVGVKF